MKSKIFKTLVFGAMAFLMANPAIAFFNCGSERNPCESFEGSTNEVLILKAADTLSRLCGFELTTSSKAAANRSKMSMTTPEGRTQKIQLHRPFRIESRDGKAWKVYGDKLLISRFQQAGWPEYVEADDFADMYCNSHMAETQIDDLSMGGGASAAGATPAAL